MNDLKIVLKRIHAQRLRRVYRSAGCPYQDVVEIDLLPAGLLERVTTDSGHPVVRLTDAGVQYLASATQGNRQARSAHETLVDKVVEAMLREGRIAWTGLSLRAKVRGIATDDTHWKMCQPDVSTIRNSSRHDYLEPIVHEIKVNRSDLLGDLKRPEKRGAYLEMGVSAGTCSAVTAAATRLANRMKFLLNAVSWCSRKKQFEVTRIALKRTVRELPFSARMALAKVTPRREADLDSGQEALTMD